MVLATGLERSQKWSKNESIGDLTGACAAKINKLEGYSLFDQL